MTISIDAEKKAFDSLALILDKNTQQNGNRRKQPQHNKGYIWKVPDNSILNGERPKGFPLAWQ